MGSLGRSRSKLPAVNKLFYIVLAVMVTRYIHLSNSSHCTLKMGVLDYMHFYHNKVDALYPIPFGIQ